MADSAITSLSALTSWATGDLLEVVDVSDTTFAGTGTNKKITLGNIFGDIPVDVLLAQGSTSNPTLEVRVESGGTGDPIIQWQIQGTSQYFSAGIDNSASDAFVMSRSSTLASNPFLKVSTSGNFTLLDNDPGADRVWLWDESLGYCVWSDYSDLTAATDFDHDSDYLPFHYSDAASSPPAPAIRKITPADAGLPLRAVRTTDASGITNDTTLTDDDTLTLNVEANSIYRLTAFVPYSGGVSEDLKIGWTVPASATMLWESPYNLGLFGSGLTESESKTIAYIDTETCQFIVGNLITAGTAGAFTLQWAQNSSGATSTYLETGAYIELVKLS